MITLSPSEAQELVEHLATRQDIWVYHDGVWVRQQRSAENGHNEYLLALRIVDGPEVGMQSLFAKPVTWTQSATDEYIEWLLEKYTAFSLRQQVLQTLKPYIKTTASLETLSKDICEIQAGAFVRKKEQS